MTHDTTARRGFAGLLLLLWMAGCAGLAPGGLPAGTSIDTARHGLFAPTGEYALPDGGTRLEYARGAFGRRTDMLDFDRGGALVRSQQVLDEPTFATITPGLTGREVLMRIGHPAQVFGVPWQRLHVWNYRWFGGDCVWFQVSVSDADDRVTDAGIGQDPACDGPNGRD
ncbi:MAG TPA: hypothetical protein VNU71_11720 [Burkholderiaceae bacterium]|nr:hypothetical protein [Burkholderiaceae bacterium]